MSTSALITIAIGDFDPVLARGLVEILSDDPVLHVVCAGLDRSQLDRVIRVEQPRVAICGGHPSTSRIHEFGRLHQLTRLVVFARAPTRQYALQLLTAGAACLPQSSTPTEIQRAIHLVADGVPVAWSHEGHDVLALFATATARLSPRERQVFELLRRKTPIASIANELGLGIETVRTHTASIRRKLQLRTIRALNGMPPLSALRAGVDSKGP